VRTDSCQSDAHTRATRFVELLTAHQRDLYAYVNTLLVGDSAAADVLQDTNLDLWARLDDFDFDRPFLPWAYGFAFQRVMAFRKTRSRSRLVFNDEVVELMASICASDATAADVRLTALQACLEKLEDRQGELIHDRYVEKTSVKSLAARLGSNVNQISARLYRIRKALARCVESRLATEAR
jgi:RNA polymerase sigma-70 factor, ECF subfamily